MKPRCLPKKCNLLRFEVLTLQIVKEQTRPVVANSTTGFDDSTTIRRKAALAAFFSQSKPCHATTSFGGPRGEAFALAGLLIAGSSTPFGSAPRLTTGGGNLNRLSGTCHGQ